MLLMGWLGCTFVVHDCPHCDGFSCADVAMRDADGGSTPAIWRRASGAWTAATETV
jgi:hypothetical protein